MIVSLEVASLQRKSDAQVRQELSLYMCISLSLYIYIYIYICT